MTRKCIRCQEVLMTTADTCPPCSFDRALKQDRMVELLDEMALHRMDLTWQLTFEHVDWEHFDGTLESLKVLDAEYNKLEGSL